VTRPQPAGGEQLGETCPPRVAVVVPTFNGERYLDEQLSSIARQTRPPDEVLVGDDASSDGTVRVARDFASRVAASGSKMTVRVLPSETNQGLAANLARLVRATEADVVFFSDQDDVWRPRKIETMLESFDAEGRVELVVSDSQPFDSSTGAPAGRTLWRTALGDRPASATLLALGRRGFVAGHDLAAQRTALLECMWPESGVLADYWLALVSAARGTLVLVDEPLVDYRQHGGNFVGSGGRHGWRKNVADWSVTAGTLENVLEWLRAHGQPVPAGDLDLLARRAAFLRRRVAYLSLPLAHPLTPLALMATPWGYRRFAHGAHSFAGDLLAMVDRRERLASRRRPAGRAAGPAADETRVPLRLGVYADLSYVRDADGISSSTPFVAWLSELAASADELVLFGRLRPGQGREQFALEERDNQRFVALPYYERLHHLGAVARAARRSLRAFAAELDRLDAVLLFGPHPLSELFGARARLAGVPVVVGAREELAAYVSRRAPGWAVPAARPVALLLEVLHRSVGSPGGAVVVGGPLARRYSGRRRPVLATGVSLLRRAEVPFLDDVLARPWPGSRTVVSVGRLDPEKNPLLLVDVAERLRPLGWTVEVAGTGRLGGEMRRAVAERDLSEVVRLHGRLTRSQLFELYGRATVLLHVSHTEGRPQVLYEAAALGLPIVATAVGGVPEALDDGGRGLLVPPDDVGAIVDALDRLDDEASRRALVEAAWRWARDDTGEAQAARVVAFVRDAVARARQAERPVSAPGAGRPSGASVR